jgi:hypothetical protein
MAGSGCAHGGGCGCESGSERGNQTVGMKAGLIRQSNGRDGGGGMVVPSLHYCLKD